jgi:hypothetical protein
MFSSSESTGEIEFMIHNHKLALGANFGGSACMSKKDTRAINRLSIAKFNF